MKYEKKIVIELEDTGIKITKDVDGIWICSNQYLTNDEIDTLIEALNEIKTL